MSRLTAVCLALVLVLSGLPPLSTASHADSGEIVVTYHVEEVANGTATITATASLPSSITEFTFHDDYSVTDTDGFQSTDEGLEWDGYTDSPSVTYRAEFSEHCPSGNRVACVNDDGTALVDIEAVDHRFTYRYTGSNPGWSEQYRAADGIEVLGKFSITGGYDAVEREVDGVEIQFRYPDSADVGDQPTESVSKAAEQLDVNGPERAAIIGAPSEIRGGGLTRGQSAWVNQNAHVQSPDNTWIHEYVHTRQPIAQYGDGMDWYYEASASYQSGLLSLRQGEVSHEQFHRYVSTDSGADRVLSSESTRTEPHHYTKGRRVMAALDVQIRQASDGEADTETVLRMMNEHEGEITYDDFADMVERAAGENMDGWLDRHVKGDAVPDVPDDPSLYADTTSNRDSDGDGLPDQREFQRGTNPFAADTDSDGLTDNREVEVGSDPTVKDTDSDGLTDGREVELGSDPTVKDTDGDGLADGREVEMESDPTVEDTDGDGLVDGREVELGSDPTVEDTDGDGLNDGREVEVGSNPTTADTDGDGLTDGREVEVGSDPTVKDTDGDGLADDREAELGSDPTTVDTDGDGLSDRAEARMGLDPTETDTDGDGVTDIADPFVTGPAAGEGF